jgi:hypothetical protein
LGALLCFFKLSSCKGTNNKERIKGFQPKKHEKVRFSANTYQTPQNQDFTFKGTKKMLN